MTATPPSYKELQERIAALEAQARMIKSQERKQAILDILTRMERSGVTIADLRKWKRDRNAA
tara:strand:+ start:1238 stop:1423 length:186 start_codon:yes stop_codon:yes gene_type:complete